MMIPYDLPQYATNDNIDKLLVNQAMHSDGVSEEKNKTIEMLSRMFRGREDGGVDVYLP